MEDKTFGAQNGAEIPLESRLHDDALDFRDVSPDSTGINAEPNGMDTSFSSPIQNQGNGTNVAIESAEKAPFLERDIESQEATDREERAKQKAKEAGEVQEDMTMEENEFWTDEEEELDPAERASRIKTRNPMARAVLVFQKLLSLSSRKMNELTKGYLTKVAFLLGFVAYFIAALIYDNSSEGAHRLVVCTLLGVLIIVWDPMASAVSKYCKRIYGTDELTPQHKNIYSKFLLCIRWLLYAGLAAFMLYTIVDEGRSKPENLRGLPGLFLFILILILFCPNPHMINWHTVYWSFGLQFLFAVCVLRWEQGRDGVVYIQDRLDEFFASTKVASKFVFGDSYKDHFIVFGAMPTLFFTNAVLTVLYYVGAVQYFVRVFGGFLNFVLDTSPAESSAVAASMFMEGIAALLTMRAYLRFLSKSQLFLVITSAFASLGGAYLAMLSAMGIKLEYLLSAMVISAPATFAVCKVMVPETKWTKKLDRGRQAYIADTNTEHQKYNGAMDAAQTGATMMLSLVGGVVVVIFTFFSFIDWVNSTLTWFGDRVGVERLTIELISSYLLYPVALMMGIEPDDCRSVGMLLGYRLSMNNMIGFLKLRTLQANKLIFNRYMRVTNNLGPVRYDGDDIILVGMRNKTLENGFISDRSEAIVTYSLCGFSSMMSVFMLMGVLTTLVPSRKKWILSMVMPGLVAGNIANCMTGCFASLFY